MRERAFLPRGGSNQKDCYEGGFARLPPGGGEANEQGGCPTGSNEAIFRPGK